MKEEKVNDKTSEMQMLNGRERFSQIEFSLMILFGIIGIFGWITLFSLGLMINSKDYRDSLLQSFNWSDFFMGVLTYTPTNIAILCVIAAFAGGCASRLLISGITKHSGAVNLDQEIEKTDSQLYMIENPFSSMMRGLVVYFAYLAGVFIANSNPFANTSPEQYAQSAGIVSLFSFVVGFDPTVFRSFISLSGKIKTRK